MKLFAIYVGGEHPRANIELHDIRFIAASTLRDTYPELRRQWWGKPASLHIDCWAEIDHADGYDVTLRSELFSGPERLYFVNLGGYAPQEFTERHKLLFTVAKTKAEAKVRAVNSVSGWASIHRDNLYEAEQAFALDQTLAPHRLHIHLTRSAEPRTLAFNCGYMPIRKSA